MSATRTTKDGLTPKMLRFSQLLAVDGNASAAYRTAYDAENMLPETVTRAAHDLAHDSKVAARVETIHEEAAIYADLTPQRIAANVLENRRDARKATQFGAALKADQLLGEMIGVLGTRRTVHEGTIRHEVLHASLGELDADQLRALVALGKQVQETGKMPALPAPKAQDADAPATE